MKKLLTILLLLPVAAMATNVQVPKPAPQPLINIGGSSQYMSNNERLTNQLVSTTRAETTSNNFNEPKASVNISSPHQWPSGFATGFSSSSPAGCKIGMGLNGGYGGATIPIDDEDCELAVAAQMALSVGDIWGYCKLMAKTEAYELAEITVDQCFARNNVVTVSQPSGKVTEPLQSYKDIQTPALDRLGNR